MSQLLKFKSKVFNYEGPIDDAKSIVNRLLIVQSHYKNLKLGIQSDADDVLFLQQALGRFENGRNEFDLGSGGTSLRFFLGRLSRTPGRYRVRAHERLLARPQEDLFNALAQLGTLVLKKDQETLHVVANGWQGSSEVFVKSDLSSQFVSSILLNSWNLEQPLTIKMGNSVASESFFLLTKNICQQLGMMIHEGVSQIEIDAKQIVKNAKLEPEPDASSIFTLACFAVLFGTLKVKPCENKFGQPDFQFLKFFEEWNLTYELKSKVLHIVKQDLPKFVELNVASCPDLFPVLCAMISFSEGMHKISGAPHLVNKESNRIEKTFELLQLAGIPVTKSDDGLVIHGHAHPTRRAFKFDPDNDHRMAFAAAIFSYAGFSVELSDIEVVNKSFPQFWDILGLINE